MVRKILPFLEIHNTVDPANFNLNMHSVAEITIFSLTVTRNEVFWENRSTGIDTSDSYLNISTEFFVENRMFSILYIGDSLNLINLWLPSH